MTPSLVIPVLLAALLPLTARAHAILIDSTPLIHGSLPAGQADLLLRFNSRIDPDRSRLTLIAPDDSQSRLAIAPGRSPDTMAASASLAPGNYTMHWQVLAVDGHITRGDIPFTVTSP